MVTRTDVRGAERLLAEGAQLIDVLPASIYAQEHLPGAVSVPLETMSAAALVELDREKTYVVYCFDQH